MSKVREDRWSRADYTDDELLEALLAEGMAGQVSHDRANVAGKVRRLVEGDPDVTFGLTFRRPYTFDEVMAIVDATIGFRPEAGSFSGPTVIDAATVLDELKMAGDRLALAAERGEEVLIATGHPVGMVLLYIEVARELAARGAKLLRPLDNAPWTVPAPPGHGHHHRLTLRYLHGVAVLTDRAGSLHTHSPDPMERMLADASPDLVLADHGFAGAAIQAGIDTVCVTDVNDPALLVAKAEGRTDVVVTMDDNVVPENYWPCYQAIIARFPR